MLIDRVRARSGQSHPKSLFAAGSNARPARQPLRGDVRTEIAIVGAGYTGLSTALQLARKGAQCIILEANEEGWGASGRNGGQINPGLKHGPDQVARDLELAAVRLSQGAPDRVFELVEEHGIDCDIHRGGTLRAATDAASLAQLQDLALQCRNHQIDVSLLDENEMAQATGTGRYRGGLFDPDGGQVNPLKYARGLAAAVRNSGVTIHCDTPVTEIRKIGASWRLRTPGGTVLADKLLLATNGYTGSIHGRLGRSVLPVFSAIVASRPLPPDLAGRILAARQSLFEVGAITTYYRVDADRRLIFGGRGTMKDEDGPTAFPSLVRYAEALWPELADIGWEYGWNGRVALTADHYPHLHVEDETFVACLGYNGRGVAMATAMGWELANVLTRGRGYKPVLPVTPIRTIAFQPFWKAGVVPALAWARFKASLKR